MILMATAISRYWLRVRDEIMRKGFSQPNRWPPIEQGRVRVFWISKEEWEAAKRKFIGGDNV